MRLRPHHGVFEGTGWLSGEAMCFTVVAGLVTVSVSRDARSVVGICRGADGRMARVTSHGLCSVSAQQEYLTVWSPVRRDGSIRDISER